MGTIDGRVIAYDRESGAELWNAQVSSEVLSPPASADGIVVVARISAVEVTDRAYRVPDTYDFERSMRGNFGVWQSDPFEVECEFCGWAADYVEAFPESGARADFFATRAGPPALALGPSRLLDLP